MLRMKTILFLSAANMRLTSSKLEGRNTEQSADILPSPCQQ